MASFSDDLVKATNNMGYYFQKCDNKEKALAYYRQALGISRIFSRETPEIAELLHKTGACLSSLNKSIEAVCYDKQAVIMSMHIYQNNHPNIDLYLNHLASTLNKISDPEILTKTKEELKPLCDWKLGKEHPLTKTLLNSGQKGWLSMSMFKW
ncbi:MAG: tetratricopeptide repeat protein [Chlamydiota bacterium]